jgi:eukaryotic-like serine/threonine-protein kinase
VAFPVATSDLRAQLQTALGTTYTLERELGRGGMATVYLAQDTKHHRSVALKVLHPDLAASLGSERFRREITLAAGLQYPHILSVYDSGETPAGQLWFTMPYVEGESLRDRIRREHQLPLEEAVRITREAALALDYAHGHGVVHRDIKPENLLLTKDGSTLVADFGIARALTTGLPGETLTETGVAVGTPQYMSPEQASADRTIDARTDVYSLGAVCYEMLAGEPPFTGPTAQSIVAKMMSGEPPSVRRARPTVPASVDAAIRKALAPVPADRFVTTAAFAKALAMGLASAASAPTTIPSVAPPMRGRGARGAVLTALAVGVVAAGTYAWRATHTRTSGPGLAAGPTALAVLPFENEGDTANAYFASGITDEIRGKLSAIPALRLIASASSNQYRHTTKPQDQIGRELGVRYLLTGRVQWEQGANGTRRVRVSPELVEVQNGAAPETKWQQSYDTTLADVFDVQSAVATRVADKLGVVLSPPAQTQIAARPTQNLAAYDAYLRSTALVGFDPATVRRALAAAEQAVALDSGFAAAWARVSTRHTLLYFNSIPTRADADAARRAAERAVALAPTASEGYIARGEYNLYIASDPAAARVAFETAIRLAPSSSEANLALSNAEASLGQWPAALGHFRQAAALDPRSAEAAEQLSRTLLSLRRYPEARAEAERGLTLAPADLALTEDRTLSRLGEGDLAGARAGLRDIPPTLDRATLAAYVANFSDLYWALDSADRALVLTLPLTAFDDDRGEWGLVRAELYWLAGDTVHARIYADSARVAFEAQLRAAPDDNLRHLYRGLALAYLGQRGAAGREGERGLALAQATGDEYFNIPYARHVLARIYVVTGDHAHALDQLDTLLAKPYFISPAWLRIDPTWAPLKGDPRFQRLLAQPTTGERPPG